ncbi:MAG: twin-arginine translocase TatA/TatE family subunit [Kiloniellales bacterium]|jgi:sec-independent protein translocase protein TatA|nr:twin-arginine translocase TatA/TatE family subunit [Kiloniellales bacterium]
MGTFSIWHWLIVLVVVLVLFGGGGKIPKLMRDMGQGINAFKKGLKEEGKKDNDVAESDQPSIEQETATSSAASDAQDKKAVNS